MINGYTEIRIGLMEEGDSYSNRRGILSIQGDEFAFFDNDLKTLEKAAVAEVIEFIRSRRTLDPAVCPEPVMVRTDPGKSFYSTSTPAVCEKCGQAVPR